MLEVKMTDEELDRLERRCLENARRLLADARYLFAGERFPTAYFIAAIAGEEIGKRVLLQWKRYCKCDTLLAQLRKEYPSSHEQRHIAFGVILDSRTYSTAITRFGARRGLYRKGTDNQAFLKEVIGYFSGDSAAVARDELKELWLSAANEDQRAVWHFLSQLGILQGLKEAAVYVDREPFMDRDVAEFEAKETDWLIESVEDAIHFCQDFHLVLVGFHLFSMTMGDSYHRQMMRDVKKNLREKTKP